MQYPSRNQMKKAFRNGHGVYEDGQSSFSVNCQEARRCGRLPMTQAVKLARALLRKTAGKITIARIRQALKETHDGVPKELENSVRFSDFLQFEEDWPTTNRERGILIDKNISGTVSTEEQMRLDALQAYADYHIDQVAPRPTHVLDELEKRLFPGLPKKDGAA